MPITARFLTTFRVQRQALGIRYYPVGLAQFTPRPSFSEYICAEVPLPEDPDTVKYGPDGDNFTNVREYIDIRKDKIAQIISNRINEGPIDRKKLNEPEQVVFEKCTQYPIDHGSAFDEKCKQLVTANGQNDASQGA